MQIQAGFPSETLPNKPGFTSLSPLEHPQQGLVYQRPTSYGDLHLTLTWAVIKGQIFLWMKAGPSGSMQTAQDQTGPETLTLSYQVEMETCHICVFVTLRLLLQPLQAWKWTIIKQNMLLFYFFLCLSLQPAAASATHTSPTSQWMGSQQGATDRTNVFSRSLWGSVLLSFLPLLSVLMADFSTLLIWSFFSRVFGLSSCLWLGRLCSEFTAGATPKSFFSLWNLSGFSLENMKNTFEISVFYCVLVSLKTLSGWPNSPLCSADLSSWVSPHRAQKVWNTLPACISHASHWDAGIIAVPQSCLISAQSRAEADRIVSLSNTNWAVHCN